MTHVDFTDIVGLAAGLLTTVSMLPQVIQSYKSKSTKDISLPYIFLLWLGLLIWGLYGFLISSLPIILTNTISFGLASAIILLKMRHG